MAKNKPHKASRKNGPSVIKHCADEARLRSFKEVLTNELSEIETSLPTHSSARFATDRLKNRSGKRMRIPGDNRNNAIRKFEYANGIVASALPNLDQNVIDDARDFISHALEGFTRQYVSTPQLDLDLGLLCSLWRFGPGSNVCHSTRTDFLSKVTGRWSVTEGAFPLAICMAKLNPHIRASYGRLYDRFHIVEGSKGFTVPKNEEIDRFCGSEPLWNMASQLAAGMYVEGALRYIGLDIRNQQELNKSLAYAGSKYGHLATIDLSMASDLISPTLIKTLWPSNWYHLLMQIRSPILTIDGRRLELQMLSTMGNGFTFPVMTLTLLALCYGASSGTKRWFLPWDQWAVYGDDIICPVSKYTELTEILQSAGLLVNEDKSYSYGDFRESCGGDFYMGHNVTPFYVQSLRSDAEVYVAINQCLSWCARTRVPLVGTLKYLFTLLHGKPYLVPEWESDTSGIRCSGVRKRYKRLDPVRRYKVRNLEREKIPPHIATAAALAGYVTSTRNRDKTVRPDVFKHQARVPQGAPIDYVVSDVRLPKGYLTGHDPVKRASVDSCWIDRLLAVSLE